MKYAKAQVVTLQQSTRLPASECGCSVPMTSWHPNLSKEGRKSQAEQADQTQNT